MTYKEFRDKYNGKYIDYDNQYGAQCWDLAQKYFTECLKLPASILGGCGLVSNMLYSPKREVLDKYFYEVPTSEMKQGDTVIWEYGHIAIYDYTGTESKKHYYFSQNPNPCQLMQINKNGYHAFRLKGDEPTITPNVERDETKNQVEVLVDKLRVRTEPSTKGTVLGYAKKGFYNVLEQKENDGYLWFKIADSNWIATSDEWTKYYPANDYKTLYEKAEKEINNLNQEIQHLRDKIDMAIKDLS